MKNKLRLIKSAEPVLRSGEPLSITALGNLSFNGKFRPKQTRIQNINGFTLVDQQHCFTSTVCSNTSGKKNCYWVRVPGYTFMLNPEERSQLISVCQLNDSACLKMGEPPLNSLYNIKTKSLLPVSLHPKYTEISYFEEHYQQTENELADIELAITTGEYRLSSCKLLTFLKKVPFHPRALFDLGAANFCLGNYQEASFAFHQAALFGHPDALEAEWETSSFLMNSFRTRYPEVFGHIQGGEPLRALTILRALKDDYPLEANAILAYSLRLANEPLEGLQTSKTALLMDPHQSDVYGHLWSYLTHLKNDGQGFEIAKLHLHHYPCNPAAYRDAFDSALLLRRDDLAFWYSQAYALWGTNSNSILKIFFEYYDFARDWRSLKEYFEALLKIDPNPIPDTLVRYGETLTELENFPAAFKVLEQAISISPHKANTVLAYGRALARSGDLPQAIKLTVSVLGDWSRNDGPSERVLITSFLSELYRNNQDLEQALALWDAEESLNPETLSQTGPRPFVEYAYCCAENNDLDNVAGILNILNGEFQDEYIVKELRTKLENAGYP